MYFGASYYIEVFSVRYHLQFEKKKDLEIVAQAAAGTAYEIAAKQLSPTKSNKGKNNQDNNQINNELAQEIINAATTAFVDNVMDISPLNENEVNQIIQEELEKNANLNFSENIDFEKKS